MNKWLKLIILAFTISSIFGCKKDESQNEDNIVVESYTESSFDLIDESIGGAVSIEGLNNDEYLLLGEGQENEIFYNIQLTKIDNECNKIWMKSYGGTDNDFGKQVLKLNDGLMLIGSTRNMVNGAVDFHVIKTDQEGEEIWSRNYGGANNDHAESIIELEDGNFMILGLSSNNNTIKNRFVIMIDEDGDELWSKVNESNFDNEGWSIAKSGIDEFVLLGTNLIQDGSKKELEIEKIDIDGNSLWKKHYESIDRFQSNSKIIKSNEGGYIIISTQSSGLNNNDSDILILKIDENGNKEWSKTYGGDDSDRGSTIVQTNDNHYLVLGNTGSYGNGFIDIIVIKINEEGEQVWAKTYGGTKFENGNDLIERDNGEIFICGAIEGESSNTDFDLLILKLDSNGNPI